MNGITIRLITAMWALTAVDGGEIQGFPAPFPGTARKVCQLTGDFDKSRQEPTLSRTFERFGLPGTDLGHPVEHKGKLFFFFGDTLSPGPKFMRDPIAYTTSDDPQNIRLDFLVDDAGHWRPLTIPGIGQRGFEVPTGALSVGRHLYVVFSTDSPGPDRMGRTVLAVSEDDAHSFRQVYDLSQDKFINVAMAEVEAGALSGLPSPEDTVLMWGSGAYRRSDPYLAHIPSAGIRDKSKLRYFAGLNPAMAPVWSTSESDAAPLFTHKQIGELSVVWCKPLEHWIMLYNAMAPRGVVFRAAKFPWGPWSDPAILFSELNGGYGVFVHSLMQPGPNGVDLSDPGRRGTWGGIYAPYMIPRYFRGDSNRCTIYFVLSTWNPYQVVLMQADIGFPKNE